MIKLNKIIFVSLFFILTQWGLYNIIPLKREGIPISWSYYFKNSFINPIMAINRLSKSIVNFSSSFLLPFLGLLGLPPHRRGLPTTCANWSFVAIGHYLSK